MFFWAKKKKEVRVRLNMGSKKFSGKFDVKTSIWDMLCFFEAQNNVALTSSSGKNSFGFFFFLQKFLSSLRTFVFWRLFGWFCVEKKFEFLLFWSMLCVLCVINFFFVFFFWDPMGTWYIPIITAGTQTVRIICF